MKSIRHIAILSIAFLIPVVTFAGSVFGSVGNGGYTIGFSSGNGGGACYSTICGIGTTILYMINFVLVPVLFAIAFIVFLYGIAKAYIFSVGNPEDVKKGHSLILWGIIGFVVMISLWGIVNVVTSTFGLYGQVAPLPPISY